MKNETFTCTKCGAVKPVEQPFTGYGVDDKGNKVCYECCGKDDAQLLREKGKLAGYLVNRAGKYHFTNWPGTFDLPVGFTKQSWHNFAGRNGRTDFWLTWEGRNYHGVQIGNGQCATIKKLKS